MTIEEADLPFPDGMRELSALCCGCGDPTIFWQCVLDALERANDPKRYWDQLHKDRGLYFAVSVLDCLGFTDHGSSIAGAWLSPSGEEVLRFLRRYGTDWENKGLIWTDSEGTSHGDFKNGVPVP